MCICIDEKERDRERSALRVPSHCDPLLTPSILHFETWEFACSSQIGTFTNLDHTQREETITGNTSSKYRYLAENTAYLNWWTQLPFLAKFKCRITHQSLSSEKRQNRGCGHNRQETPRGGKVGIHSKCPVSIPASLLVFWTCNSEEIVFNVSFPSIFQNYLAIKLSWNRQSCSALVKNNLWYHEWREG